MSRIPDRWLVLRVAIPEDEVLAALLADALIDLGGRAVWEAGGRLTTHLPEPDDPEAFVEEARRALEDAVASPGEARPEISLDTEWQLQEDWSELWKRGLKPRRLTDRIVVTPSWWPFEPRAGDIVLTIDPGMAFGNAEHGTTRGCLRLLDGCVKPGDRVLDVGAGSGILSIAAARLGAGDVLGLEADPWAVDPARENVEANGAGGSVRIEERTVTADVLADLEPRDGVICNMEFGCLRPLIAGLLGATRPGGWLILSGVLQNEWAPLLDETGGDAVLEEADVDGEWRSGLFRPS